MTTHSHRRNELSRVAIAGAFLLAGLAGSGLAASAGPPLVDDGGSGGGGETSTSDRPIFLEHFGLVATNDGPGSFSMNSEPDADQVPTLVGSGPEREFVYEEDEVPTLVGSGPEREFVYDGDSDQSAALLDETARSNDLIALSSADDVETAIAHRGQPY